MAWTEQEAQAAASRVGLVITPAQMPGVLASLGVAEAAARVVAGVPLAPTDEPAPVFAAR